MSQHPLEQLSDYRDKTLPKKDAQKVAAHLTQCPSCQAVLTDLERTASVLHGIPAQVPTKDLENRIVSAILRGEPSEKAKPHFGFGWFFSLRGAAILTTCALALVILYPNRRNLKMPPLPPEAKLDMDASQSADSAPEKQVDALNKVQNQAPLDVKFLEKLPSSEAPVIARQRENEKNESTLRPSAQVEPTSGLMSGTGEVSEIPITNRRDKTALKMGAPVPATKPVAAYGGGFSGVKAKSIETLASVDSAKEGYAPLQKKNEPARKKAALQEPLKVGSQLEPVEGAQTAFTGLQGSYSGISEKTTLVINTEAEWDQIWTKHLSTQSPGESLPSVDFTKNQVLAIVAGNKPSSGYSVSIRSIQTLPNGTRVVEYLESRPSRNAIAAMAITQPFLFKVVPRINGPTIFRPVSE